MDPVEERSVAVEVAADGADDASTGPEHDRKLDDLRHEVAERGGVPLRSSDDRRYGARFCVTAPDPAAAVAEGVKRFRRAAAGAGLADSPVLNVEAPTLAELDERHTGAEVPDLVDIAQVAELLGAESRLATILVRSKGFPAPAAELSGGPVWTRPSVVDFLRRAEPDCAQCGFVYAHVPADHVPRELADSAGRYRRTLLDVNPDDLRAHPLPGTWSALEYACHVRDVLDVQRHRVRLALETEGPVFEPMGRDERVEDDDYNSQDPAEVAAALVAAARALGDDLAALDWAGWQRTAVYPWPEEAERTLEWLARHSLHEMEHHMDDVESVLAASRKPVSTDTVPPGYRPPDQRPSMPPMPPSTPPAAPPVSPGMT